MSFYQILSRRKSSNYTVQPFGEDVFLFGKKVQTSFKTLSVLLSLSLFHNDLINILNILSKFVSTQNMPL